MAVHRLGSLEFKQQMYDSSLWKESSSIGSIVYDFLPPVDRVTSKSENTAFTWLYGKFQVVGNGEVQVRYPYTDSSRDVLTLRNVSFSSFPFVTIQAVSDEGWEFNGWWDSCRSKLLSKKPVEIISQNKWLDITSIEVRFENVCQQPSGFSII